MAVPRPLEVVMFMRDVASAPLYTQMKGRGVRTIGDEQLRNVTPNAISKDCFFLVDAVGVTEHEHIIPGQYQGVCCGYSLSSSFYRRWNRG